MKGLWNATSRFIARTGVTPQSLAPHLTPSGEWNNNMYYTNFEISRFDWWRSAAVRAFCDHLLRDGGVYSARWGDAPIHLLAVSLFLPPAAQQAFTTAIPYWHQYYVNLPQVKG